MKLLVIARPFVFHGGVERATAGLVRALVEHGYDVHLLTPCGRYRVPGVTHHALPLPPLPAAARALALAAAARVAVARRVGRRPEPRAHAPPGRLPRGGGLPPRLPREPRGPARARALPPHRPRPRASRVRPDARGRRDRQARGRRDRGAVRGGAGAPLGRLQRRGPLAISSAEPRGP